MTVPQPVLVLMGGRSAEREISLESGEAVAAALERMGIEVVPLDWQGGPLPAAVIGRCRVAFIALHGRGGEDGRIQGYLDTIGMPYTGSGVLGSALAMDKPRAKALWRGAGLPTPPWCLIEGPQDCATAVRALGLPLAVKPCAEGSSLGITRVDEPGQLEAAWRRARRYDRQVMAERWIDGEEYTAAILGEAALPLVRLEPARAWYDYEAKYADDAGTRYHCPSGLPAAEETELAAVALSAFRALGASGWGRVDLVRDRDGEPWLLEVNTVPGMTSHSLVPMAAAAGGIGFDALVRAILMAAVPRGGSR